jgi:hypothetical protein
VDQREPDDHRGASEIERCSCRCDGRVGSAALWPQVVLAATVLSIE